MFDKTKTRVINPELAAVLPKEAANLIWDMFDTMLAYQAIMDPVVTVQIADAVDDGKLGLYFVQESADGQELEGDYAGDEAFLGKGLTVEIIDHADVIYMDFAEMLKAYLNTMHAPIGWPDAEWDRQTIVKKYQIFAENR